MSTAPRLTTATSAALAISIALVTAVTPSTAAQPAPPATTAEDQATRPPPDERVRSLIARLSDEDWRQRAKAEHELIALGDLAEPRLRQRLTESPDAETRTLIASILSAIAQSREFGPSLITLRLDDATPQQAFAALAERSGIPLAPGAEAILGTAADQRITMNVEREPFWRSLLNLGARSGIAFNSLDPEGRVVLETLPSNDAVLAPPAATVGPFLVTIHHIETNLSKSVAFAGKRPLNARQNQINNPPCRVFFFAWGEPRLRPIRWFIDSVDECVTDTGHDMRHADPRGGLPAMRPGGASGGVNGPMETSYTLPAPDAAAKRIARLALTARFVLLKRKGTLEVGNVLQVKNAQHVLGGFRVVIDEVNKVTDGRYELAVSIFQDGRRQSDWDLFRALLDRHGARLIDAEGRALSFAGGSSSYRQGEIKLNHTVTTGRNGVAVGEPAKLVWEFPEDVEQVTVPLVFRDVPLP